MQIMGTNPGVAGEAARRGWGGVLGLWPLDHVRGWGPAAPDGAADVPGPGLGRGGSTAAPFPLLRPPLGPQAGPLSSETLHTGASEWLGQWQRWVEWRTDAFTAQTGNQGTKLWSYLPRGHGNLGTRSKTKGWSLGSWSAGSRGKFGMW